MQPSGRYDSVGETIFGEKFYVSDMDRHQQRDVTADDDNGDDDDDDDDMVDIGNGKCDASGQGRRSAAAFSWAQQSQHPTSSITNDLYRV